MAALVTSHMICIARALAKNKRDKHAEPIPRLSLAYLHRVNFLVNDESLTHRQMTYHMLHDTDVCSHC